MLMFTLQTLGLLFLFGAAGVLLGWLIRSFLCKPKLSGHRTHLSSSVNSSSTPVNTADVAEDASSDVVSADTPSTDTLSTAAMAATGTAAIAATALASTNKDSATDEAVEVTSATPDVVDSTANITTNAVDPASDVTLSTDTAPAEPMPELTTDAAALPSDTTPNEISDATAGMAGVAAVAAAAYSAGTSATESDSGLASNTATTQDESPSQDEVKQLRTEAEALLNDNFTTTDAEPAKSASTSHIIIGAGPAGVIAAETIRKLDATANITLIGDEPEAPYSRMAIPYFLEENIQAEGTHLRKTDNYFEDADIQLISGRVKNVDTQNKLINTANGLSLAYDKLLIATGSHPLTPPIPGLDNPKVGNCWNLADSRKIIEHVKPGASVVQIGAGFIGCIILEALVKRGAKLTVVEMDNRMVPRMLDEQCGGMLKSWCESKGVTVLTETQVNSIEDNGERITVNLSKGEAIDADYVISATGVASNTRFLEGSGIDLDQGILVNHYLETNIPDVYAAGDVAQGIDFTTGGYSVHAIQPTAADHGMISAKNMVKGNQTRHKGSLQMNILSTLDLISTSYGAWEGVEGGEHSELVDTAKYRYIRLQFKDDKLVGANTLGITQNIGALRGLIQNQTKLGVWKERLMNNPLHFMDAYVSITGNHV